MKTVNVSRSSLQDSLNSRLDAALQGQESVFVVTGDAGSGKTRLLQQFASDAQEKRDDLLVAYSACNAITGITDAYMPFREILQHLSGDVEESVAEGTASAGNASRVRRFMQKSARALVENGPDLVDIFVPGGALLTRLTGKAAKRLSWFDQLSSLVDAEKSPAGGQEIGQDNINEQYTRVIEAIAAEAPLLLIIDDLHWSDQASLGLLFQLSRRLVNNPVSIIAATRPPDGSAESQHLGNLISELRRYFGDTVLDLSEQPAEQFIDDYLAALGIELAPEVCEQLAKQTDGNPLLVAEILKQGRDDNLDAVLRDIESGHFPAKVTGVFDRLFSSLSEADKQTVATASVQGHEFWAELVADVNGESTLAVVRRLSGHLQRDCNIVVDTGSLELESGTVSRFAFRHDLLREYVYQSLTSNERRLSHQAVAQQLEQRTKDSPEDYCVLLADQFSKAHEWTKSLKYRIMAAEKMARAYAPGEAAGHYARAIKLCEEKCEATDVTLHELKLQYSAQQVLAGEYELANQAAQSALETAASGALTAKAWLAVGGVARRQRDYLAALSALDEAQALLDASDDGIDVEQLKIDVLLERGVINYFLRDPAALGKTNQELAELIDDHGTPHQRVSYFESLSRQALGKGNFAPSSDAILFANKAVEASATPDSMFGVGFSELWNENFATAIEKLEQAGEAATKRGNVAVRLQSFVYLSVAHRRLNNIDVVEQLLAEIESQIEIVAIPEYVAVLSAQQGWLAYRAGEHEKALRLAQSATEQWSQTKATTFPFCWLANWVILATANPSDPESTTSANHMLAPGQAWQREAATQALQAYLEGNEHTVEQRNAVVAVAEAETYL